MLENKDIERQLVKLKPTIPADLYDEVRLLKWSVAQEHVKSVLLQRQLLHINKEILRKEMQITHNKLLDIDQEMLSLPSLSRFLPHLKKTQDSFKPEKVISNNINQIMTVVYGITITEFENLSKLVSMLQDIFSHLNPVDRSECLFALLIKIEKYNSVVVSKIKKLFSREIRTGLLHIVIPPKDFYPDFQDFKGNSGDSKNLSVQHAKQNLNMVFLMMYVRAKAAFYIQLDIELHFIVPEFASKILNFVIKKVSSADTWIELSFTTDGCAGKLYRTEDLDRLIPFMLTSYNLKPCDWLLFGFIRTIVCHPERSNCTAEVEKNRRQYRPVLFKRSSDQRYSKR